MVMKSLKGLATGVGSLPYQDADGALDLIFKYVPNIPFWPQLPQRNIREGMIAQFSENIPCLKVNDSGVYFDPECKEESLERFYSKAIAEDLDYFKISDTYASGLYKFYEKLKGSNLQEVEFIKLQVTGPFTFAAGLNNESGVSLLHDKVMMQVISTALKMKASWQVNKFKEFGKKMILFIDEPYLGCFGSAYTPINRETVASGLLEFTEGLRSKDVLMGIHCCGNTDWSIFTEAKGIDVINFDAFDFQDKFVLYADSIRSFLERGGIICWGIVPTQNFTGEEDISLLIRKMREGVGALAKKGIDEKMLKDRLIISPACGLGTFAIRKAEGVFKLLSETSKFIREEF
jgi:methionine synthase II (cobalamin-independent)